MEPSSANRGPFLQQQRSPFLFVSTKAEMDEHDDDQSMVMMMYDGSHRASSRSNKNNDESTREEKKLKRVMANRKSAKESRERRKQLLSSLEGSVDALTKENVSLQSENDDLRQQIAALLPQANLVLLQRQQQQQQHLQMSSLQNSIGATNTLPSSIFQAPSGIPTTFNNNPDMSSKNNQDATTSCPSLASAQQLQAQVQQQLHNMNQQIQMQQHQSNNNNKADNEAALMENAFRYQFEQQFK